MEVRADHPHGILEACGLGSPTAAEEPQGISPTVFEACCVEGAVVEEQGAQPVDDVAQGQPVGVGLVEGWESLKGREASGGDEAKDHVQDRADPDACGPEHHREEHGHGRSHRRGERDEQIHLRRARLMLDAQKAERDQQLGPGYERGEY